MANRKIAYTLGRAQAHFSDRHLACLRTKDLEIQDVCFSAAKAAADPSLSGHQQMGFAQKSFWLLFPAGISLKPF